jgi:hypothetical protein
LGGAPQGLPPQCHDPAYLFVPLIGTRRHQIEVNPVLDLLGFGDAGEQQGERPVGSEQQALGVIWVVRIPGPRRHARLASSGRISFRSVVG